MSNDSQGTRALVLSALMIASVVAGSVAFAGAATAATNTSISPDDDETGASSVEYTADGQLELNNTKSLVHVDVHLGPADTSDVGEDDVSIYVGGTEYQDGFDEFDSSSGTVEFKLSNSQDELVDGNRIRVVVDDVTNPSDDFDANATFHDSSDEKFQTYEDTVDIDTSGNVVYSDLAFNDSAPAGNDTTVNVGEDLNVSATVENTVDRTETYNASLRIDGSVVRYDNGTLAPGESTTATFDTDFSETGTHDVAISDELEPTEVTVTGPMSIADGSAEPSAVEAGTTVSDQQIHVEVSNVSQDGDTDTHYVEFPNALAGNVSVNSASADGASVTSSPELVEGYDGDDETETVKFATSGDGGGDADLNLTVNASVAYPDEEATYGIDARVVDSGGDTSEVANVTEINASSRPEVTDYAASNPTDRDVNVSFNSSEELADIAVDVTNSGGETVTTLTESDFNQTQSGDTYEYDATTALSEDGDYDVTLRTAADAQGTDAESGQTESVTINVRGVDITDGSADPARVSPGTTVNNQEVTVTLADVSADGDADTHYVEFPDSLASGLSVNSASVNGSASIDQSAQVVEGYDDDGADDTVRFQTDTDAGGTVDLNVTVDASVDYPDADAIYEIDARVEDSDGDNAEQSNVTSITAGEQEPPAITDYAVTNPDDRDISVRFDSDRELRNITVDVTDGDDETVATLTESDFAEANESGTWVYEATYAAASDGTYTATLTEAADADGNDGSSGESDSVTLDTAPATIVGGSANPSAVEAGTTVNNQEVTVTLANVSADGDTDTHYVEFPNALAGNVSVNSADANDTSITSSAEIVDGYDGDGETETVKFATSSDAGGDIYLNVTVDVSVDYPDSNATYAVDSRLVDSETGSVTQGDVAALDATTGDSDGGDTDDSNTDDGNTDDGDTDDGDGDTDDGNTDDSNTDDGDGDTDDGDTDDDYTGGGGTGDDGSTTEPSAPTVSEFGLVADGQDVDAVVRTDDPADRIEVTVDGPVGADLTRADFNESRGEDGFVYTANVTNDRSGSFDAELDAIANDGDEATAGQTDSLTVPLPDHVGAGAVAAPAWTGDESVHMHRVPIGENASVAGETLSGLAIEYSDRFLNRSGSITSVSDDQNVVALQVVDSDGALKAELGGTDAVTVNVADDAVELDLSDVDSSRKPTLEAGDRIVVRTRPVTNPDEADRYETTVGVETAAGSDLSRASEVRVRAESAVESRAVAFVEPSDEEVTLDLNGTEELSSVTVDSEANASGAVRVTVPDDAPNVASSLSEPVMTTMDISRPDASEDDPATLTVTLSGDEVDASDDDLSLTRYDEDAGDWVQADATIDSSEREQVTVEAVVPETSAFALTTDGGGEQSTAGDREGSDGQASTDGDDGGSDGQASTDGDDGGSSAATAQPMSVAVVAALALIVAGLLLFRRRRD